jgi:hypothetical protein
MKHIRTWISIAALSALAGCQPKPTKVMFLGPGPFEDETRFEIRRVGVIKDDIAYHERRAIYVITDTRTGKEYMGLSGVGISELGSHAAAKTRVADER